ALRGKEYLYQRFFEHSGIPLFVADGEGVLVEGNVAFYKLLDKTEDEMQTLLPNRIFIETEKDCAKLIENLNREKNLEDYTIHLRMPGGKGKRYSATLIGVFDESGRLEYIHGKINE
ncbi:MAG TPA: hypothetical protein PK595_09635, partial [Bacteroidota bacterium]|nr:hypothetical protein [Bacteroidota bacterium]